MIPEDVGGTVPRFLSRTGGEAGCDGGGNVGTFGKVGTFLFVTSPPEDGEGSMGWRTGAAAGWAGGVASLRTAGTAGWSMLNRGMAVGMMIRYTKRIQLYKITYRWYR